LDDGELPIPEPIREQEGRWREGLTAEDMGKCRWLQRLIQMIDFAGTPANHLRHSKFIALREDKNANQIRREVVAIDALSKCPEG
jgi:hypothetical protein